MNESTNPSFLEKESLGRLMRKYAIPCVISLLVAALYNIVDQIFIANADYLGSYGNAVILCISASLILTAVYFLFQDLILTAFGGRVNEETFAHSKEYFIYIAAGIPFYMFGQAMNPVIRSDGSPRFAMFATLGGALVNIILDPIFIFPLHLGMMGAAVATVAGQIFTAVLSIWHLCHMKAVKLRAQSFRLNGNIIAKFMPLGICSFLSQISLVAAMAAINNMVRKYGALDPVFGQAQYAQIPMAVVGIVMKFFQIVISIVVGMAAGYIHLSAVPWESAAFHLALHGA